jgi:hypothetical protein
LTKEADLDDGIIHNITGMRAATLDELTADYEEYGIKFRKQISKTVLRKGGPWASAAFVFQDLDIATGEYGEPQLMLATFKISGGKYTRNSYYIVKNKEEGEDIWDLTKTIWK